MGASLYAGSAPSSMPSGVVRRMDKDCELMFTGGVRRSSRRYSTRLQALGQRGTATAGDARTACNTSSTCQTRRGPLASEDAIHAVHDPT